MNAKPFPAACLLLTFVPMVSHAAAASPYRTELENVIFYQRLVTGGSGLAYKTYTAQVDAFTGADRDELSFVASWFQNLAAMELGASELFTRRSSTDDEDWQERTIDSAKKIRPLNLDSEAIAILRKRMIAATDTTWLDDEPSLPESAANKLQAAATWARTGQTEWLQRVAADLSLQPTLSLSADGKVIVDYEFYDPAIFRIEAVKRTDDLYSKVMDDDDVESSLVALWCEIFLQRTDNAKATIESLTQFARSGRMTSDQIEELQFLGAAMADQLDEHEQVEEFLQGRITNPPQSPWALRALNLIPGHTDERLEIMHQTVAKFCQSAHPFAREVLSNIPEQTERVLDCYWEVAWGHRSQAVTQNPWWVIDAPSKPALRAKRLVAELSSPSVAEAWRERSALRLESVFEANVLSGDAETWQLALTEDHIADHPILEPVIKLSRVYSGLERTRVRQGDIESLANDVTKDVAHLLLGQYEASRIDTAPAATMVAHKRRGWRLAIPVLVVVVIAAGLAVRRRKGSAG